MSFNNINNINKIVIKYLNSLSDDCECIYIRNKNLTFIPDLSRFTSLKELHCYNNELTSLPEGLSNTLLILICSHNQLTSLPLQLPNSLIILNCSNNQLTSFPPKGLPNGLKELKCYNNCLTSLPSKGFPNSLHYLNFANNPIFDALWDKIYYNNFDIPTVNKKNKLLKQFVYLFYSLKYKQQLIKWLWVAREKIAMKKYSPENLLKLLNDIKDDPEGKKFDDILNSW